MKKHSKLMAFAVGYMAAMLIAQIPVLGIDYTLHAFAEEETDTEYISGNFKYKVLESGEAEITGWAAEGWENNVDIPAQVDGFPVVSIGEGAFYGKMIRSLKLPYGLREIKSRAFFEILSSIEIPETVEHIDDNAFSMMDSTGYFAMPSTLEYDPTINGMMGHCPILKYHIEDSKAVVDEFNLGYYYNTNLYIPETICGNEVKSVLQIISNSGSSQDRPNAVICKEGVALPDGLNKIEVRFVPDGDDCRITAVTGNYPNVTLNLVDTVNGRRITGISGVTAQLNAIAVPSDCDDGLNVSFPVLYGEYRSYYLYIVRISLNESHSLSVPSDLYIHTAMLTEDQANKVSFASSGNRLIYGETEDGVEIRDIVFNRNDLFIPTVIDGKPVVSISDDCPKQFLSDYKRLYIPGNIDSEEIAAIFKYAYIENSDSVSVTGYISGNNWGSGGQDLEDVFGMPIDTLILQSGLSFGVNYNKDKNTIIYKKNNNGDLEITQIRPGSETSTVTIPETIGGLSVSGFADGALNDVTSIIVPESLAGSVPADIEKVEYKIDEEGNFIITNASENADVKFPESVERGKVDTVFIEDDIKDKVDVSKKTNKIAYEEDDDGNVTVTDVQVGEGNEKATIPDKIDGKEVDLVIVEEGTNVDTPKAADKITYTEDENGNVTVTDAQAGEGKDTVTVPDKIGGKDVDTVIIEKGTNVDAPKTANQIIYEEDEDGNVTVTDVQMGEGKEKATVPDKIGGKNVDAVLVREGTDVDVPDTAAKITYTEDEDGNITITEIIPAKENGEDKSVKLPDEIEGKIPQLSDQAKKQLPHEHTGGLATCTEKAKCDFCGEEYGKLAAHNYVSGVCTECGADDPDANSSTSDNSNGGTSDSKDDTTSDSSNGSTSDSKDDTTSDSSNGGTSDSKDDTTSGNLNGGTSDSKDDTTSDSSNGSTSDSKDDTTSDSSNGGTSDSKDDTTSDNLNGSSSGGGSSSNSNFEDSDDLNEDIHYISDSSDNSNDDSNSSFLKIIVVVSVVLVVLLAAGAAIFIKRTKGDK